MQYGALLGDVDLLATEHRVDASAESHLVGQREQQAQCLVGHAMLGIVEIQAGGLDREPLAALWILVEHGAQVSAVDLIVMLLQGLPRRAIGERN